MNWKKAGHEFLKFPSRKNLHKPFKSILSTSLLKKNSQHRLVLASFSILLTFSPALAAGRQQLHGHMLEITKTAPMVGHLKGTSQLHLAIGLPLRNQETLQYLLKEIYDPNNPNYRHFLTPEKFTEMFGPLDSDYQKLIAFARANNLTINKIQDGRVLLDVSGTAADVEQAFHVNLNQYQHYDGSLFYAPDSEPSIDLDVAVAHISGLDNYGKPIPAGRPLEFDPKIIRQKLNSQVKSTGATPNAADGSQGGMYIGQDLRNAYVPCTSLTGTNQSVALVEFDGFYASDITNCNL